jgi:hypothetical protein
MGLIFTNQPQLSGNKPVCLVSRSTTQSIAANTSTTIAFNTVSYDNFSGFNTGSALYTFPWTGLYRVSTSAFFNAIPTAATTPGEYTLGIYTAVGVTLVTESFLAINMSAGVQYVNILTCQTLIAATGGTTNVSVQGAITPAGTTQILASALCTSLQIEYIQP